MNNRYKIVKIASILGIIGNLFLFIIKFLASISSNSSAMLADAINSASDIFSSIMTFIGNKIASNPPDEEHNLGYGKAEYIYSLLISITMILISLKMLLTFSVSLISKNEYIFSLQLIIACIITILVKISLYIYTNKLSKKHYNILLEANAKDHRNDSIITTFNLIAAILSRYNIYFIDNLVGILISIWIFITALKIFKESYNILIDKSINKEVKKQIYQIISKHKEIKNVKNLNSSPIGYLYQISLTIFVDGNLTTFESHAIADKLEQEIKKEIEDISLIIIHINPLKL